jgi:hypothetical protein
LRPGRVGKTLLLLISGLVVVMLTPAPPAAAADDSPSGGDRPHGPTAGGRLIWDSSGELDLLGDLWADVPIALGRDDEIVLQAYTRTNILRPTTDLAFELQTLDYLAAAGYRTRRGPFRRMPGSLLIGQRGKAGVDRSGHAWVRFVGAAVESQGYRYYTDSRVAAGTPRRRVEWRGLVGPVVEQQRVSADLVLRGDARVAVGRRDRPGMLFEIDLGVDGLADGSDLQADYYGGPAIVFPVQDGKRARFFLHYVESENPLGLGHAGVLLGFEYSGKAGTGLFAPLIDGVLGGGGGEGRSSGELLLRFLSPRFGPGLWASFVIDLNVLTAEETRELYYLFHVGLERSCGNRVGGVWLYHRSNHELTVPNDTITSLNVLEAGVESRAWYHAGRRPLKHRWGRLDYRGAAGVLLTSSFGEEQRWHLRGGLRWSMPLAPEKLEPFILARLEAGDVERQVWALGISPAARLDLQLEYRKDPQLFGEDKKALLLLARYGFQGAPD